MYTYEQLRNAGYSISPLNKSDLLTSFRKKVRIRDFSYIIEIESKGEETVMSLNIKGMSLVIHKVEDLENSENLLLQNAMVMMEFV